MLSITKYEPVMCISIWNHKVALAQIVDAVIISDSIKINLFRTGIDTYSKS